MTKQKISLNEEEYHDNFLDKYPPEKLLQLLKIIFKEIDKTDGKYRN